MSVETLSGRGKGARYPIPRVSDRPPVFYICTLLLPVQGGGREEGERCRGL